MPSLHDMDTDPEATPSLLEWLREAAVAIGVEPRSVDGIDEWQVVVHNGQGGHEAAGTTLAKCGSQLDAELVAAGLWALARP
jgi:hypothetical protein